MEELKKNEFGVLSTCAESWRSVKYLQLMVYKRYVLWFLASLPFFAAMLGVIIYSHDNSLVVFHYSSELISILATFVGTMIMVPLVMTCLRLAIHLPQDQQVIARECSVVRLELMKLCVIYAIIINVSYSLTRYVFLDHSFYFLPTAFGCLALYICMIAFYAFSIPLVVTRKMNVMTALLQTLMIMQKKWKSLVAIYLIVAMINIICLLLAAGITYLGFMRFSSALMIAGVAFFIITQLWLTPWFYAVNGVVFREAFRLKANESGPVPVETSMIYVLIAFVILTTVAATPLIMLTPRFHEFLELVHSQNAAMHAPPPPGSTSVVDGVDVSAASTALFAKIRAIDDYAQSYVNKNNTYMGMNLDITPNMPGHNLNTPWGTMIVLTDLQTDRYTVTLVAVPPVLCVAIIPSITWMRNIHVNEKCSDIGASNLIYTYIKN